MSYIPKDTPCVVTRIEGGRFINCVDHITTKDIQLDQLIDIRHVDLPMGAAYYHGGRQFYDINTQRANDAWIICIPAGVLE